MFVPSIQDPQNAGNLAPQMQVDAYGQMPKLASTFHDVDGLFYFTYAVCIFFFVLILGVLLFSVVKYRRKTDDQPAASNVTHNTPLEVVWTVIPLIIVMIMFAWGFKGSMDMTTVPLEASRNTYKATAKQWKHLCAPLLILAGTLLAATWFRTYRRRCWEPCAASRCSPRAAHWASLNAATLPTASSPPTGQ